jgi:hypothetical protein
LSGEHLTLVEIHESKQNRDFEIAIRFDDEIFGFVDILNRAGVDMDLIGHPVAGCKKASWDNTFGILQTANKFSISLPMFSTGRFRFCMFIHWFLRFLGVATDFSSKTHDRWLPFAATQIKTSTAWVTRTMLPEQASQNSWPGSASSAWHSISLGRKIP